MILRPLPLLVSLTMVTGFLEAHLATAQYTGNIAGAGGRLEAIALRDSADRLLGRQDLQQHRKDLARLYARAATLLPPDDPEASQSLLLAGHLLASQSPSRAAVLMRQAGDRALAIGDVRTALLAYLDVVSLGYEQYKRSDGNRDTWAEMVHTYAQKAKLLAASPLLSDHERAEVYRRLR